MSNLIRTSGLFKAPPKHIIDVGAAGLQESQINPDDIYYLFEPEQKAYDSLVSKFDSNPNVNLFKTGLFDKEGSQKLYVTNKKECSSLFQPNVELFEHMKSWPTNYWSNTAYKRFKLDYITDVNVSRLDNIIPSDVKVIDLIKLDTQGSEYEILKGCGDLLNKTKKIICEVEFIELYKGQKLYNDINEYLQQYGFNLEGWERQVRWGTKEPIFGDAIFTKK
jgi:FkbM family methyltransferase